MDKKFPLSFYPPEKYFLLQTKVTSDLVLSYLLFELEVEFPHCFLSVPYNLFAPEKQTLRWKKQIEIHETLRSTTLNKF